MSRSNIEAVRDLQGNELTIMTKSQEGKVLHITIKNSNDEDSDDELNNAVIYDSDDDMIKKLRKWDKLRRLNNLSPRLKNV